MMAWMGLALVGSAVVAGGAVVATGKGVPTFVPPYIKYIVNTNMAKRSAHEDFCLNTNLSEHQFPRLELTARE